MQLNTNHALHLSKHTQVCRHLCSEIFQSENCIYSVKNWQRLIRWHSGQYAWQSLVTEERSWWWLGGAELKLRRGQASSRWKLFDCLGNILEYNSNFKLGEVKCPPGESFYASTILIPFFQVLDLEEVSARQCRAEYKPLGVELLDRYQTL